MPQKPGRPRGSRRNRERLVKNNRCRRNLTLVHALPEGNITSLAIQPKSSVLYIGTSQSGVYRSSGGAKWIPLSDGLPSLTIQALAVGSDESNTIYASTDEGVFFMKEPSRESFVRRR